MAEHIAVKFAKIILQNDLLFFGAVHNEKNRLVCCGILINFSGNLAAFPVAQEDQHIGAALDRLQRSQGQAGMNVDLFGSRKQIGRISADIGLDTRFSGRFIEGLQISGCRGIVAKISVAVTIRDCVGRIFGLIVERQRLPKHLGRRFGVFFLLIF